MNVPEPVMPDSSPSTDWFSIDGEEFSARWASATDAQINMITNFAEQVLGPPDTLA